MLPQGFQTSGLSAGIKASGKKDLGLIHSEFSCHAAGVFTQNTVKAHCVTDNQETLKSGKTIQAILVNSGNANACTGEAGLEALKQVKREAAKFLNLSEENILSASTGIIGVPLPAGKIVSKLPQLSESLQSNYHDFAEAILTTDLKIKTADLEIEGAKIFGVAKGSGMIHPNMGTMLAFVMTDLELEPVELQEALKEANEESFNQISVDGDTSTNDMVLLLANGASKKKIELPQFKAALKKILIELAKQIVQDGEGATKIFEVKVSGAASPSEARQMAKGMVSSSLVKSAIFGHDPNWGRLLAAAGQHGTVYIEKCSLRLFDTLLLENGQVCAFDKKVLAEKMAISHEIKFELSLGGPPENYGLAWGCDLTYEYVKINAEYTT